MTSRSKSLKSTTTLPLGATFLLMSHHTQTIYVFGNPLLDFDNLPLKILPELEKQFPEIDFIVKDPNENLHPENKQLTIIDTVMDIHKVTLITDIDKISRSPSYSLHDLDLGFNLKLLKKIGLLEKVAIIGVPPQGDKDRILNDIIQIIKQLNDQTIEPQPNN